MRFASPAGSIKDEDAARGGSNGFDSHSHSDSEEEEEHWEDARDTFPSSSYPNGREPEEVFTDDEIKDLLAAAETLKQQGNDAFRQAKWEEAVERYGKALKVVPRRKERVEGKGKGKEKERQWDDEEDVEDGGEGAKVEEVDDPQKDDMTPLERECSSARAVLNSNLAACYVKLNKHEEAVKLCTEALEDDPRYIKALHRRATTNDLIGSWTALSQAERDYKTLLTLLPPSSPLRAPTTRALKLIPPRIEAAKKRETDEMMGKLKELGNTVLGKFGLSTDNFKFTPNGQGGYSMNFAQ